jgi:hypothetical protein
MSLPPLPKSTHLFPSGKDYFPWGHTDAAMTAYGQQCWNAAIEAGIKAIERLDNDQRGECHSYDLPDCVMELKGLKK